MRRAAGLLAIVFLITGCTHKVSEIERGLSFRTGLLKAEGCSFTAEICADYGEELYTFGMECTARQDGTVSFTVTQPDTISGIQGRINNRQGEVIFGEKSLSFPLLADGQASPVSCPWIVLKALREGNLASAGMEDDLLRLCIDDSCSGNIFRVDVWLDESDTPVRAEVCWKQRKILSLTVDNFKTE